mgnify:CR=1 FL=1
MDERTMSMDPILRLFQAEDSSHQERIRELLSTPSYPDELKHLFACLCTEEVLMQIHHWEQLKFYPVCWEALRTKFLWSQGKASVGTLLQMENELELFYLEAEGNFPKQEQNKIWSLPTSQKMLWAVRIVFLNTTSMTENLRKVAEKSAQFSAMTITYRMENRLQQDEERTLEILGLAMLHAYERQFQRLERMYETLKQTNELEQVIQQEKRHQEQFDQATGIEAMFFQAMKKREQSGIHLPAFPIPTMYTREQVQAHLQEVAQRGELLQIDDGWYWPPNGPNQYIQPGHPLDGQHEECPCGCPNTLTHLSFEYLLQFYTHRLMASRSSEEATGWLSKSNRYPLPIRHRKELRKQFRETIENL